MEEKDLLSKQTEQEHVLQKFETMSIFDIEDYGKNIQAEISNSMDLILENTRCIDAGKAGKDLGELSVVANTTTKELSAKKPFSMFKLNTKKWLSKFDTVENRINSLSDNLEEHKENLNQTLQSLYENREVLKNKNVQLIQAEENLTVYYEFIKEQKEDQGGDTALRKQAVINRLKTISTLRAITEQEIVKSALIIQENKEITNQLENAITEVIPIFKMQMVDTLALKATTDAIELKEKIRKTTGNIMVENAKMIRNSAIKLQQGRTSAIVDVKNIKEANDILQDTLTSILKQSKNEVHDNEETVKKIKAAMDSLSEVGNQIVSITDTEDSEQKDR